MEDNDIPPFVTTFLPGNIRRDRYLDLVWRIRRNAERNNLQHSVPVLNVHMEFSHSPLGVLLE